MRYLEIRCEKIDCFKNDLIQMFIRRALSTVRSQRASYESCVYARKPPHVVCKTFWFLFTSFFLGFKKYNRHLLLHRLCTINFIPFLITMTVLATYFFSLQQLIIAMSSSRYWLLFSTNTTSLI